MEKDDLLQHKRDLIDIYTKNLQVLEKESAKILPEFDLGIVNQMENIRKLIAGIELELSNLAQEDHGLVKPVPYPLQKYENFITKFSEEISAANKDSGRLEKVLLISLRQSSAAKSVFIARYVSGDWKINSDEGIDGKEVRSKYIQSDILNHILNTKPGEGENQRGLYYAENVAGSKSSLLLPFTENNSEILIFHELDNDIVYDKAFEIILRTIIGGTKNFSSLQDPEDLELVIYNNLRKSFGFVSDAMYNRQYYLFNKKLESMSIEFEPIIHLHPHAPSIFGWEALARDPKTSRAPITLFETADIWGVRFQLQLDMYFLKKATELYVLDKNDMRDNSSTNKYRRKHTILPLSVNVHPSSLLRSRYRETIQAISNQGNMPVNELYLEISEKNQIPIPDDWNGKQNAVEAFRDHLDFYRDLDIHFSIDDFGIGYSSSSRVSRLGPAAVKIDRDALSDTFGDFTLNFVVSLARKLPGETKVIMEGYDEESGISLKEMYELKIRYVQGHKFGRARSIIDDRLPKELVEAIQKELK
jgi:EAL domain-containing protein (putative c-di-GMP-specific phosphodiesterase class I)